MYTRVHHIGLPASHIRRSFATHWPAVRIMPGSLRGPTTTNPKLVNYLAAGGVQGLRPMRYEKRVARNRFLALVLVVFVILFGIFVVFLRNNR